jgi:hypothetical protein
VLKNITVPLHVIIVLSFWKWQYDTAQLMIDGKKEGKLEKNRSRIS